jgi:hypothetical protein
MPAKLSRERRFHRRKTSGLAEPGNLTELDYLTEIDNLSQPWKAMPTIVSEIALARYS